MNRTIPLRRGAALLLTLMAAASSSLVASGPAVAMTADARVEAAPRPTTDLTFALHGCKKCEVTLHQAISGRQHVWQTKTRRADHGVVTFTVPSKRTRGLDATIRAPWEGPNDVPTGYVSQVVFRYGHEAPGSAVTFAEARAKKRGSACWAGTAASDVTIPVEVRKVRVDGTTGRTDGTLAWTQPTEKFWKPMERTIQKGIFGAQDVPFCDQP